MRETHRSPKEEQRKQEEPLIPEEKKMRYEKIHQNHVDKKILNNNPNKEVPRGAPRVQ